MYLSVLLFKACCIMHMVQRRVIKRALVRFKRIASDGSGQVIADFYFFLTQTIKRWFFFRRYEEIGKWLNFFIQKIWSTAAEFIILKAQYQYLL